MSVADKKQREYFKIVGFYLVQRYNGHIGYKKENIKMEAMNNENRNTKRNKK